MPVQHLPKATNVTIRAQRGSQMAPAPPADGKFYTPAELAAMTNDEQLYLAEHPRFWVVNPDDHQEDFSNDEFADPDSSPSYVGSASGDTHMSDSGTVIADKGKTGTNSLGLGLPARQFTPSVTVGQPPAPLFGTHPPVDVVPSLARLHNASQRQANLEASGGSSFLEKNVGRVYKDWSFKNCPHYTGDQSVDVKRWLSTLAACLDSRQAHPGIWHLVGFRLLEGKAFHDYEDVIHADKRPDTWHTFCIWLIELNPLCTSKESIEDDLEKLNQLPNEDAQAFFLRFRDWQNMAKNYGIVRAGRIAGRPLTFDQIVVTALEEDKEFRSRITSTYSISQVNNNNTRMASTSNNTNGGGSSKRTRDSSRACFNCGGDNHVSSNCTEPKTAKQLKYEAKRAASSSSKTLNV
ncbi:hypothetical protein Pst134EA_000135 [Puccinia striiformis f. sp. tritici]|uniref:hypothetical protein n=1 Tax=Puccinia striiformis f. sp. tritici TaxID=168172 RepID=UPI0020074349|nr:hypothetical protein Pst134EA_000135 [Puccinia striiformis f. sp. tritici]KAH9473056.1 hypothetical protein Pst134EA_000135 [Puccinia striiformis f. sp. tritici]